MRRIEALYATVAGQYSGGVRTVIDKTEKMFRTTRSKFLPRSSSDRRGVLTNVKEESRPMTTVPEFADVVIIGGGSAGCNALYHLAKQGTSAILLERSKLTSGTTWHTGGLVWRLQPNDVGIRLLNASRNLYKSLEEETGVDPGWTENGGLFIARSEVRMDEYKRLHTCGKALGVESQILSPKETKELFPLLDEKTITGSLYSPGDGTIDPTMMVAALTKAAKSHGARVIEDCPVSRIFIEENESGAKRVTGVETPFGKIRTGCVLNAAGAWAGNVAKLAGLSIPLVAMKHAYVITESIPGIQNFPNIRDHDASIYVKVLGTAMEIGGYEPNPIILKSMAKDFSFGLYELDWNIFNQHVDQMVKLIPKLSTVGIKTTICGPESFTPDHKPLMGEDPRCSGFFYSCGYNSAGMMLGGGCGEEIASWIINGRPNKDMYSNDIRRFSFNQMKDSVWANEKSHEAYATNYDIVFPHNMYLSGRNFKKSCLHDHLVQNGAVMEEFQGWERPGWFLTGKTVKIPPYDYYGSYGSKKNVKNDYASLVEDERTFDYPKHHDIIRKEALACRNNAALFDVSYYGKFYLCGAGAQAAADYLFTANTNCDLNETVYTCTLNKRGGVEGDCTVTRIEPGSGGVADPIFQRKAFYIVSEGIVATQLWAHMNKAIREKGIEASLHDATENLGVLSLQGPNSRKILQEIADADFSDTSFSYSTSQVMTINGCLVRAIRTSSVGELGYDLHIPSQSCEKVFQAIVKSGEAYKLKLAGSRALYSLHCEKGNHLWHADLTSADNPIEAGLESLCKSEGEFMGQKAVKKMQASGIKRQRVQVYMKDRVPIWGLEAIYRNDTIVGYTRRAEYSYTMDHCIGQAYISHPEDENVTKSFIESGDYQVEVMGEKHAAEISLESRFDPENRRLRGEYPR